MDLATLILEYVKALVWPAVVIGIAIGFRTELTQVVARLTRAQFPGGLALDFEREVQEAKRLAEKVPPPKAPPEKEHVAALPLTEVNTRMIQLGLQPSPSGLNMDYYREIAVRDPGLALAGLRIEIDTMARNLAKGFGVPVRPATGTARIMEDLLGAGAITSDQWKLTKSVMDLANKAAHGPFIPRHDAMEVLDVADTLAVQYVAWLSWGFPDGWNPPRSRLDA